MLQVGRQVRSTSLVLPHRAEKAKRKEWNKKGSVGTLIPGTDCCTGAQHTEKCIFCWQLTLNKTSPFSCLPPSPRRRCPYAIEHQEGFPEVPWCASSASLAPPFQLLIARHPWKAVGREQGGQGSFLRAGTKMSVEFVFSAGIGFLQERPVARLWRQCRLCSAATQARRKGAPVGPCRNTASSPDTFVLQECNTRPQSS